jgi:hypothetical protein
VQLLQPRLFLIHPAAARADFTITETSQLEMLPWKTHFKLVRHSPAEHLVLTVGQAVGRLPLRPPLGCTFVFVFGGLGAAQGALQPARELAGGGDGVGTDAIGVARGDRRDAVDLVAVQRRKRPLGLRRLIKYNEFYKMNFICERVALVCIYMALVCEYMVLVCEYMVLVCEYMVLVCEYMVLVCEYMVLVCECMALVCEYIALVCEYMEN